MLVLSRKEGEVIVINGGTPGEIRVTVVSLQEGKVRIGIEAPKDIPVYRSEIQEAINREAVD